MPKRVLRNLKLSAIAAVDNPCQEGAKATTIKRAGGVPVQKDSPSLTAVAVAKYISDEDGAHTFAQVLEANLFEEKIWPMTSALSQSIRSIMGDKDVARADKEAKVQISVDEFLAAVRDLSPTAEKSLITAISKGTDVMNWEQIAKDAQAEVTSLTSKLAIATAEIETVKAASTAAATALETEKAAHAETKKSLTEVTDEVIKVGTTEIRKSVVGDAQFTVAKALSDERDVAKLEKRASDEFGHVAGSATEKALVLKAADKFDEPTRKAFDAIMTSAEKMSALAFDNLGGRHPEVVADTAKAHATFKGKVAEIAKRDSVSEHQAMAKARQECPDEFAAAYPDQAEAA